MEQKKKIKELCFHALIPHARPAEEAAHGTHVAGIAAGLMSGVGKQATVMAIKGLKCT